MDRKYNGFMDYPKFPNLFPIRRGDFTLITPSAFELFNRLMRHTDTTPGYGPWRDCWIWTGDTHSKGYGKLEFLANGHREQSKIKLPKTGRTVYVRAHRLSYLLHHGEIPPGKMVCHTCDVTRCVNPDHLFAGNAKRNFEDSYNKGRHSFVEIHKNFAKFKNDENYQQARKERKRERKRIRRKLQQEAIVISKLKKSKTS